MFKWNRVGALLAAVGIAVAIWSMTAIAPAFAIGQPSPGQMGLSESATEVMSRISNFYDLVNGINTFHRIFRNVTTGARHSFTWRKMPLSTPPCTWS